MLLPILTAEAQDVDVPGNLTIRDSTGPAVGNILKGAALFLHNFGADNTFLGKNAGNLTMTFPAGANTGIGSGALQSITIGYSNTASGDFALGSNTTG